MGKKIQVTVDEGIYDLIDYLAKNVYQTKSHSKVCSKLIESALDQKGYLAGKALTGVKNGSK